FDSAYIAYQCDSHLATSFFFFFQAEDGIRGGHVTRVQTCALPICTRRSAALVPLAAEAPSNPPGARRGGRGRRGRRRRTTWSMRSEERRVGKECRCRSWA